ncbi:MAG: phage major tail tube protein [Rhodanobacter sp.]|nr:phage major tail tube protein [Rhodanobacter sp.]
MALPSKLKNFNLFNDGNNYLGKVSEITLPKLTRKVEEWRGGGMDTGVEVDMGGELIILEWTAGGLLDTALKQFGATAADAAALRFAGAYQRDDDGGVDAVEVIVRGRHKEIDLGNAKPGDTTAHKFTTTCSYYRLDINGTTVIEIDALAMVFNVGGVDRLAEQRRALGV